MNKLIIQEFIEHVKLLDQVFVKSVDYSSHNSNSMCLYRVKHLVNSDCFDLFSLHCGLKEYLGVDVVVVL